MPSPAIRTLTAARSPFASPVAHRRAVPRPAVQSASLAMRLRQLYVTVQVHGAAVHRDARLAAPHRARMWDAATSMLEARPSGADADKLRASLAALRAFTAEFHEYKTSGDAQLQTRIFAGASADRPGLTRLLDDVLEASGMGRVQSFVDVVDA
jgi:hypothetical protein